MIARCAYFRTTKLNCPAEPSDLGAVSVDAFLGGSVQIAQPLKGYRAGVDPVLLAASIPAVSGQTVLELGCGGGVASLCLGRRVSGLKLTGVEIQPAYAALARANALRNDIAFEVFQADLNALPSDILDHRFDHVLANPPYYDRARSTRAHDDGREIGLGEATPLKNWVRVASKRLAPRGHLHFIHRVERLPELLSAMPASLGSIEVQPLCPRAGRNPHLVLVRAKKEGRADFCLHAPIVMHKGATHDENPKEYNAIVEAVLRRGASLGFGPQT